MTLTRDEEMVRRCIGRFTARTGHGPSKEEILATLGAEAAVYVELARWVDTEMRVALGTRDRAATALLKRLEEKLREMIGMASG